MRPARLLGWIVLVPLFLAPAIAEEAAKTDAKPAGGEVRRQTLIERNFLYVETETTFTKMAETVVESLGKLDAAQKSNHAKYSGPLIMVYRGLTMDPNKPFKLQIGYSVDDDVKTSDGVQVRKLEEFTCSTSIYTGAVDGMGPAVGELMAGTHVKGWKTADELREYYLYWENESSANNIVLLAVGLK